jgi:putative FmdB family regulatory protein
MPIYDFQCTSCGHKDELMRKISESSTLICPQCSQETFVKMLSAPSFQLSGSGWYASDFKDKKENKTNKSTAPDKPETKPVEAETKAATSSPVSAGD